MDYFSGMKSLVLGVGAFAICEISDWPMDAGFEKSFEAKRECGMRVIDE